MTHCTVADSCPVKLYILHKRTAYYRHYIIFFIREPVYYRYSSVYYRDRHGLCVFGYCKSSCIMPIEMTGQLENIHVTYHS